MKDNVKLLVLLAAAAVASLAAGQTPVSRQAGTGGSPNLVRGGTPPVTRAPLPSLAQPATGLRALATQNIPIKANRRRDPRQEILPQPQTLFRLAPVNRAHP